MGRQRQDTVGSILAHGEYEQLTLTPHPLGTDRGFRWRCSCGQESDKWATGPHARAQAALRWLDHLAREHPEVDQ